MPKVPFPLKAAAFGDSVADLQSAIEKKLEEGPAKETPARDLLNAFQKERLDRSYGEATRRLVAAFQAAAGVAETGEVDEATASALSDDSEPAPAPTHLVQGRVSYADGVPAAELEVTAFDEDLRSRQKLGVAKTALDGRYAIAYHAKSFRRWEAVGPDLRLRVTGPNKLRVWSETKFNAPTSATLDLTILEGEAKSPPLFDRIRAAVKPALGKIVVAELEEDSEHQDLTFLAGETGFEIATLARFGLSHRLASERLPPEFWFAQLEANGFSYDPSLSLAEHLERLEAGFPGISPSAVLKALKAGISIRIIGESLGASMDKWAAAFSDIAAAHLLEAKDGPGAFLQAALDRAGVANAETRRAVAKSLNEGITSARAFLSRLRKQDVLTAAELDRLDVAYSIKETIQVDAAVVGAVIDAFGIEKPTQVPKLARRSADEWRALFVEKKFDKGLPLPTEIAGHRLLGPDVSATLFADAVGARVRAAFPTQSFLGSFQRASGGGLPRAEDLGSFLELNPAFELLTTNVDRFLENGVSEASSGLATDEAFRAELKAVQRTFKLAPSFEATRELVGAGVRSARSAYLMGEGEFVEQFANRPGFTKESARVAWTKARDTYAAALTIAGDLKSLDGAHLPKALRASHADLAGKFPEWKNLFQGGDTCECEHCRSVLSPAAYYTDVLQFLSGRNSKPGTPLIELLQSRRPDLPFLELNCENAHTTLPYIDVVCEVLEAAIAGGDYDTELAGLTAVPTDPEQARGQIQSAVEGASLAPGEVTSVIGIGGSDWVAHGSDATYLLRKHAGNANYWARLLPNTKADAEELRARPAYTLKTVYEDTLANAEYPLSLPFDLYGTETRATLEKAGLERWRVMETLRAPSAPSDAEIAAEYFGISNAAERRLITVAAPNEADQKKYWGEDGPDWHERIGNVSLFLNKTGLEYVELLELLDLPFISESGGKPYIEHEDSSCDTDKKHIAGAKSGHFDRMHRLLRLSRALDDWKRWEIDLALTRKNVGGLDDAALVELWHADRLLKERDCSVEEVFALLEDMNDRPRFTDAFAARTPAMYQRLFLNKAVMNPIESAFENPSATNVALGEHAAVIAGALGVSESDVRHLLTLRTRSGSPFIVAADTLLSNLTQLFRQAWLARAVGVPINDWQLVLDLSGEQVAKFDSLGEVSAVITRLRHLVEAASPTDIDWWLNGNPGRKDAEVAKSTEAFLMALRAELAEQPSDDGTALVSNSRRTVLVERTAAEFALSSALATRLLTEYKLHLHYPGEQGQTETTLAEYQEAPFAATYARFDKEGKEREPSEALALEPSAEFDDGRLAWRWARRVAEVWNHLGLTDEDVEMLRSVPTALDVRAIDRKPRRPDQADPASVRAFVATSRFAAIEDRLAGTRTDFFKLISNLSDIGALREALEAIDERWKAADVAAFHAATGASMSDYADPDTWKRLDVVLGYARRLGSDVATLAGFREPAMGNGDAATATKLLRARLGRAGYLEASTKIQDGIRAKKRDALVAYLLTQDQPTGAPSGKWENSNDLYAYYLLDVEMAPCDLTSRLVQASGSAQLFVQRCLMGLEPEVVVSDGGETGDSAWRWWRWMRKYRVWEANRKVFLWPENWIEPELKLDRSEFFKDLENQLVQNELTKENVEKAFTSYLKKLDGVAQLEIAGFYQEDDGGETIVHVFGRTKGAEPHQYYYRRYDYRSWTPWEKVELEIRGDYLIPAVINGRLFLFWPVFEETPHPTLNDKTTVPAVSDKDQQKDADRPWKLLQVKMAVSDYRGGKWTPQRVSTHGFTTPSAFRAQIERREYRFFPVDRSRTDGRFGIRFDGHSIDPSGKPTAKLSGSFEFDGCTGAAEPGTLYSQFFHAQRPEYGAVGEHTRFMKWGEQTYVPDWQNEPPTNDLALVPDNLALHGLVPPLQVLNHTPGLFGVSPPWHLSYFDRLLDEGLRAWKLLELIALAAGSAGGMTIRSTRLGIPVPVGSWLPWFYADQKRTFFVLPELTTSLKINPEADPPTLEVLARVDYPDVKKATRDLEEALRAVLATFVDALPLPAHPDPARVQIEFFLVQHFAIDEVSPPFSDEYVRALVLRFHMQYVRFVLGWWSLAGYLSPARQFRFKNFYHPFVCDFATAVYDPLRGIPGLMSRSMQLQQKPFSFETSYRPNIDPHLPNLPTVVDDLPVENVDFTPDGAYASYNWELFYHAPLLIANSLSKNQRFDEARDWYHYIFNPIGVEGTDPGYPGVSKYWITKPFYKATESDYIDQRIENLMTLLSGGSVDGASSDLTPDVIGQQVRDWRNHPFEPHRIANYRTVAYQKTVFMKYLDNLIAWADNLFRQDSMESVNEATQLYVLAAELLGPKPRRVPPQARPHDETYRELEPKLDAFSNALVDIENLIPALPGGPSGTNPAPLPMLYFCIPPNEKFIGYWDTIADRLYKIRNCMNIDGVVRQRSLFEPPIDPGALVKALAGGLSLEAAIAGATTSEVPHYRFAVMLQKANELCGNVRAFGSALQGALERKDAEELSLLRQEQSIRVLDRMTAIRETQVDEAKEQLEAARQSKKLAEERKRYYEEREFMNEGEIAAMVLSGTSLLSTGAAMLLSSLSSGAKQFPDATFGGSGFGGSPHAVVTLGGAKVGDSLDSAASVLHSVATIADKGAGLAGTLGGYQRRSDDWDFQARLAAKEIDQTQSQIAAAELRVAMAERELDNHKKQIDGERSVDEFMRSKYTNQELYQWQLGQISGVYFQAYKLAHELAKKAEQCSKFELGLPTSSDSIIKYGYWDSLKKGLMSGERLQHDLRRLEARHMDQNERDFELVKHVSLRQLNPEALVALRNKGKCDFSVPEEIFDLDYPGHYFRRIKAVSVTIPCVAGPYTTVAATLRLNQNYVRVEPSLNPGYPRDQNNDPRFHADPMIRRGRTATSSGQDDSGVFELNFHDERYLPFEGAGPIGEWQLELFHDKAAGDLGRSLRQFDYDSISDAVLHIRYAAKENESLKAAALEHLRAYAQASIHTVAVHVPSDLPDEWAQFQRPVDPADGHVLRLPMSTSRFFAAPAGGKKVRVERAMLFGRAKPSETPPSYVATFEPGALTASSSESGGAQFFSVDEMDVELDAGGSAWSVRIDKEPGQMAPDEFNELVLILVYSIPTL